MNFNLLYLIFSARVHVEVYIYLFIIITITKSKQATQVKRPTRVQNGFDQSQGVRAVESARNERFVNLNKSTTDNKGV